MFTTSAYDNLDHDPSSTTAKESFHGTGISIFQHPDDRNTGQCRDSADYKDDGFRKQKANLPEEYTRIKPMIIKNKNPPIPENPPVLGVGVRGGGAFATVGGIFDLQSNMAYRQTRQTYQIYNSDFDKCCKVALVLNKIQWYFFQIFTKTTFIGIHLQFRSHVYTRL